MLAPQESGVVAISNLARQFQLAGDLVLSIITPRMGTLVQGRLESGLIFTPAYIARIKAQVPFAIHVAHIPKSLTRLFAPSIRARPKGIIHIKHGDDKEPTRLFIECI